MYVLMFQVTCRTPVAVIDTAEVLVSVHFSRALFYEFILFTYTDTMLSCPPRLGALYTFNLDIKKGSVTMSEIQNIVSEKAKSYPN